MPETKAARATPTDREIADAMVRYGGSFAQKLGETYDRADPTNREKLKTAFADEWARYRELALLMLQRKAQP